MEKEQKKYNRDEYLHKLQTGQLDYNRYTNTSSAYDTTKYKPKIVRIYEKKGNLQDLKLKLIINEMTSEITINRFHGKINFETYAKIKTLLQKFYYENTPYRSKLIYNGEKVDNYDELVSILGKITEKTEDLYDESSLGEQTIILEGTVDEEIHLHIDTKEKKAYVKLPQSFGFSKFVFKEQNLKIENDIIEKIGPD